MLMMKQMLRQEIMELRSLSNIWEPNELPGCCPYDLLFSETNGPFVVASKLGVLPWRERVSFRFLASHGTLEPELLSQCGSRKIGLLIQLISL